MNIKRRIWALPLIASILFGISLAVTVSLTTDAINMLRATVRTDYPFLDQSKNLVLEVRLVSTGLTEAVTEGDKKRINAIGEQATKVRQKIKALGEVPGQGELASRLGSEFDRYYEPAQRVARIMVGLAEGDAEADIGAMQKAQNVLEADLAAVTKSAQQQFVDGAERSSERVHAVLTTSIVAAVLVVLALALVSWFVVRSIWQQLGGEPEYACSIAKAAAEGDLTMEIQTGVKDERSILAVLKTMQVRLHATVTGIQQSAATITAASAEIANGNADLAARTETQASNLEETASSMEALTETVKQNAAHAQQGNELVAAATSIAQEGSTVVGRVVSTMEKIQRSATRIADITGVIDGIAFQTNILALNAAVEAARAGEQGRGFAVVASEVRNLAQRAASASREIKELIQDSVAQVNGGTQLVGQAGQTMDEMLAAVQKVASIMAEISEASREQSTGIAEVCQAVSQMDRMTQQNAGLVEQVAGTAESLRAQADALNESLAVFKLSETSNRRTSLNPKPDRLMLSSSRSI